ncbi:hypothetical protein [Runella slithyformis]|uniref:Uncharacterized protein n=1 Tax=Runella slithyformis (strain ATCC 29530 / DSM 19594 / LMG 11500 / NCIMB 11436 / LSU 4) TaxID=761193 RepID=A0A7U4E7P0_RUNSL|nr:hypothetical protein [Runella slithyformis]AEI50861.1 hypothetical protein Runsl_4540 [Runella slithyformis DSM 19594]
MIAGENVQFSFSYFKHTFGVLGTIQHLREKLQRRPGICSMNGLTDMSLKIEHNKSELRSSIEMRIILPFCPF